MTWYLKRSTKGEGELDAFSCCARFDTTYQARCQPALGVSLPATHLYNLEHVGLERCQRVRVLAIGEFAFVVKEFGSSAWH